MSADNMRDRIGEMRALSTDERVMHQTMCSKFIDGPTAECDCYVRTYARWADYIEAALDDQPTYTPSGLDEFHPDTTHNPQPAQEN